MNSRLTVNVSLRWDFNNPYHEKYGHWSSFELDDFNTMSGFQGTYEFLHNGSESFERRQDYYNYAPHIGAAYKLDEKTVARGNGGVFFTPLNMNTWGGVPYQQAGDVGFHDITLEANFNWDNGYNPTLVTPTSSGAQSPTLHHLRRDQHRSAFAHAGQHLAVQLWRPARAGQGDKG